MKQRGVTLIEMLVVVTLIALVAGLSFPSVSAGVDSLRLRSASDAIVGFLNTALARADRHQQVVEITVLPAENALVARSHKEKPADPTTKKCPECLSEIPIDAKRCAHCTVPIAA